MSQINIPYESEAFPSSTITNGSAELTVNMNDVLHSAITVGRASYSEIVKHGLSSAWEALFRWAIVRMALEPTVVGKKAYLRRTDAFRSMDPSERGAINYFLGMTFCKVFAEELLATPWLLHFDVFKDVLSHALIDRSKPDLVGLQSGTGKWRAFESKGRSRRPSQLSIGNAKTQAQQLIRLEGNPCDLEIATFSYFRANILQFYWCDPVSSDDAPIDISNPNFAWKYYYRPALDLVLALDPTRRFLESERFYVRVPEFDIEISIHPKIAVMLVEGRWEEVQKAADTMKTNLVEAGYKPDGIAVRSGSSWRKPFGEFDRG